MLEDQDSTLCAFRTNFMDLLTAKFWLTIISVRLLRKHQVSVLAMKQRMPSTCNREYSHALKQKFPANPWNTLDVSTEFPASVCVDYLLTENRTMEFPASVCVDSLLTENRTMKLGPGVQKLISQRAKLHLKMCLNLNCWKSVMSQHKLLWQYWQLILR